MRAVTLFHPPPIEPFPFETLRAPNHTAWRFAKKTRFSRSLWAGRRCAASHFAFFTGKMLQGLLERIRMEIVSNFHADAALTLRKKRGFSVCSVAGSRSRDYQSNPHFQCGIALTQILQLISIDRINMPYTRHLSLVAGSPRMPAASLDKSALGKGWGLGGRMTGTPFLASL